jgi:hypothetical protein
MIINFPGKACQTLCNLSQEAYYITHYKHVLNYLEHMGTVTIVDEDTTVKDAKHNNNFAVEIDGKKAIFDYSDFHYNVLDFKLIDSDIPYFKFHTTGHSDPRCIPFAPMSFMNWSDYSTLKDSISYDPHGSIFYKCKIYGGAIERRNLVLDKLKAYSGVPVDFTMVEQSEYLSSMNTCRMNVVVPGATNDILDRTHLQSFALGIPVITPYISTLLPFGHQFEANIDYIECKGDFSDVIDLIERYKDDKAYLDFISNNCKTKFMNSCSPEAVKNWITNSIQF